MAFLHYCPIFLCTHHKENSLQGLLSIRSSEVLRSLIYLLVPLKVLCRPPPPNPTILAGSFKPPCNILVGSSLYQALGLPASGAGGFLELPALSPCLWSRLVLYSTFPLKLQQHIEIWILWNAFHKRSPWLPVHVLSGLWLFSEIVSLSKEVQTSRVLAPVRSVLWDVRAQLVTQSHLTLCNVVVHADEFRRILIGWKLFLIPKWVGMKWNQSRFTCVRHAEWCSSGMTHTHLKCARVCVRETEI